MSKNIKKTIKHLFAFCLILFLSQINTLSATHIVGGDMTYRCLGNDDYEITLTIRRDCENGAVDAPFDDPATVGIYDIFGSLLTFMGDEGRLEIPYMGEDTITNAVSFDCSASGAPVCVHESVYRDTIKLPYNKLGYRLAYQRCCRNSILANISDPLETGATYHVAIPIAVLTECNSQPVFNEWADVYICANEDLVFDHSATDADGDQLVYRLCTPSQGGSRFENDPVVPSNPPYDDVVWGPGFSEDDMLGSNPALSIDPNTGILTARPSQVGAFLIGICVEEYRNGEKISEVRRDFEYNVRVCGDPISVDFDVIGNDCDGDTEVTFNNTTVGANNYEWTITDNQGNVIFTSSVGNFSYDFPAFGTYTVLLEAMRDSDGCIAREEKVISIGNPNVIADFDVVLPLCSQGSEIELIDLSTDPSNSSVPVSWMWTVNGDLAPDSNPSRIDIGNAQMATVDLVVTFSSGCTATISKTYDTSDLAPNIDFTYSINSCGVDSYELQLDAITSDSLAITNVEWEVTDVNGTQTGNSDPYLVSVSEQGATITLVATFEDGCVAEITKILSPQDLLPNLMILNNAAGGDCLDEDQLVVFGTGYNGPVINAQIVSYDWTVDGVSYTTPEIQLLIAQGDTINLSLVVTYDNGCQVEDAEVFIANFAPTLDITTEVDCNDPNGISIKLTDETVFTGSAEYMWLVDGNLVSDNNMLEFILDANGNQVDMTVVYSNGCEGSFSQFYDPADFGGNPVINADVVQCDGDEADIVITVDNGGQSVIDESWVVNGVVYTSSPINITLPFDSILNVTYSVNYDNGCSGVSSLSELVSDLIGNPDYVADLVECLDSTYVVSLTDASGTNQGVEWIIDNNGVITNYTGSVIEIVLDSTDVTITQIVDFGNGCVIEETSTLGPDDVIPNITNPMLEYTIEPIECIGDSGIFVFTDLTVVPECLFVVMQEWVINGEVCFGNPVTKMLPLGVDIDFSLSITYSNGVTISTSDDADPDNDTINTNDIVDQIDIEIGNNSLGNCSDSLDLSILNPMAGVDYEWSTDIDFTNILGTGINLDTVGGDLFNGVVYVQTINNIGDCFYGLDSIIIESDAIDISFDMPFVICAGDTANFEVINNNLDQIITYEWKGGNGELIDGGNTNNPLIGIGSDVEDDFFLILCTTNNLGCTSVDTINFEINTTESLLPFTYEPDSCGSLTINFDESPNDLNDNAFWDFGDGNTGNGSVVSNTYDQPGVYTVTLFDTTSVCPQDPIMMDINVANLSIEILGSVNDTIEYENNTAIDILAETNGENDNVSWCLEDGTNIGMGNPLEDFNPGMDTLLVIAKIVDEFGCTDADTVVLIPMIDPNDCLESVQIDGPEPAVVCVGEDFVLTLTMDDECNLDDYSYMWDPTDCIVSGQGTPVVTVETVESKTIMVLVTHIATGIDSIYSYDIEVSNPQVDINVPELNIDEQGNPFVCLGESITLSVNPEDPNCTYIWSDGQMGPEIELTPEEAVTISVFCEDIFGCTSEEASLTIPVVLPECNENDVYIPNAFSPNGDQSNDVLFVRSKFIQDMELIITNRWGEEIFESTDQSVGWDGTYKGEFLAPDVFAYCIRVTCITGDEYIKVGNVSIIK